VSLSKKVRDEKYKVKNFLGDKFFYSLLPVIFDFIMALKGYKKERRSE